MTFGSQVGDTDAQTMIDLCMDRGINFFDTSNNYNHGRSEQMLGRALRDRRDQVVLASKVFNRMGDGPQQRGLSRPAIVRAVEASLRRLQTDYLDIYYLHAPDYETPMEETMAAMNQLVQEGKIRFIGASNYASWQLCRLHWIADRQGTATVEISQPMYNLLARGIEQEFLPACAALGVSTVVYNPLAGGLLTGKHRRQAPARGTRFHQNEYYQQRYWHDANFDAVDVLAQVARRNNRSLVSVALNWLLHHTPTDCVILGASCVDQMRQNIDALDEGPLPPEVIAACDQVWGTLRGITPKYNR